jgi:hypothetical protein
LNRDGDFSDSGGPAGASDISDCGAAGDPGDIVVGSEKIIRRDEILKTPVDELSDAAI